MSQEPREAMADLLRAERDLGMTREAIDHLPSPPRRHQIGLTGLVAWALVGIGLFGLIVYALRQLVAALSIAAQAVFP